MNHQAKASNRTPDRTQGLNLSTDFSLVDEYAIGFQLLHWIHLGDTPIGRDLLVKEVSTLIEHARKRGLAAGLDPSSVDDAGYAFCAAIDEAVLASGCDFREQWESHPLQLSLFGDQLAGEHFFDRLERLRERDPGQLPIVEVFHMCLVLGFRGRYRLEGEEKLRNLKAKLASEITAGRRGTVSLSPHWARPDDDAIGLRYLVSLAAILIVLGCGGAAAWTLLSRNLSQQTAIATAEQENLVHLPAQVAHLTIKLP